MISSVSYLYEQHRVLAHITIKAFTEIPYPKFSDSGYMAARCIFGSLGDRFKEIIDGKKKSQGYESIGFSITR